MSLPPSLSFLLSSSKSSTTNSISTIDLHTTGEPTRIIYAGFPALAGHTLLQKRQSASTQHDQIRRRLMHEPRGHREMYGALLVHETELTRNGDEKGVADVGVLFMHGAGWSTMCGHATLALGRVLVDCAGTGEGSHDESIEEDEKEKGVDDGPGEGAGAGTEQIWRARKLVLNHETMTTNLKLHCPCGVVDVTVPVTASGPKESLRLRSDPSREVTFVNVPSWATGITINVPIPPTNLWPELDSGRDVTVDFCYGGAFYCIVTCTQLGFAQGLTSRDLEALSRATKQLKAVLMSDPAYVKYFQHPTEGDLGFLYGVIVTDETDDDEARKAGVVVYEGSIGAETGLCFFADQQVDRSPCGSGVAGRRALAHAKKLMAPNKKMTYHSLVSRAHAGQGAFTARVVGQPVPSAEFKKANIEGDVVRIEIGGKAFYTGCSTFLIEEEDEISRSGFTV